VLSALHDLPIDDEHVQAQKRQIFEAIEVETAQQPFKLISLIWDNTGMDISLPLSLSPYWVSRHYTKRGPELQAGRRLRTSCLILCLQQLMGKSGHMGPLDTLRLTLG
jgi:hypothetical protein